MSLSSSLTKSSGKPFILSVLGATLYISIENGTLIYINDKKNTAMLSLLFTFFINSVFKYK